VLRYRDRGRVVSPPSSGASSKATWAVWSSPAVDAGRRRRHIATPRRRRGHLGGPRHGKGERAAALARRPRHPV